MDKMRGYIEWVSNDPDLRIGFITNPFGRLLYINNDWPNGTYVKWEGSKTSLSRMIRAKNNCKKGRTFTQAELMLELIS